MDIKFLIDIKTSKNPSREQVGGKGYALIKLTQLGIAVPKGIILKTTAFSEYKNGNRAAMKHISDELSIALHERGLYNVPLVVRSSATVEDSSSKSFAGQFKSIINVVGDKAVLRAVLSVYKSLEHKKVATYCKVNGIPITKIKVAVIIQELVIGRVSGVMFTKNPIANDDIFIVEAVQGLNEGLVSGIITPSRFLIDYTNRRMVKSQIVRQRKKVTLGKYGTKLANVAGKQSTTIKKEMLLDLVKIGNRIEAEMKDPQDIEWTIKDNKIFILQSRPITKLKSGFEKVSVRNGKVLSGYPGATGVAQGIVRLVQSPKERPDARKILVFKTTDTDYTHLMKAASGIITEEGGMLSHAAIVSRELNIPCVVGVKNITKILRNGDNAIVNGAEGSVIIGKGVYVEPRIIQRYFDEADFYCMDSMKPFRIGNFNGFYEDFSKRIVYYSKRPQKKEKVLRALGYTNRGKEIMRGGETKYLIKLGYDIYYKDKFLREIFTATINDIEQFNAKLAQKAIKKVMGVAIAQMHVSSRIRPLTKEALLKKVLSEGRARRLYIFLNTIICEGYGARTMYRRTKSLRLKLGMDFPTLLSKAGEGRKDFDLDGLSHTEIKALSYFLEYYKVIKYWREMSYPRFVEIGATGEKFDKKQEKFSTQLNNLSGAKLTPSEWFRVAIGVVPTPH